MLVDEGVPDMMAFSLVDQERLYLISTRGTLEEGEAIWIQRWYQFSTYVNEDAHMVDLYIPHIREAEM